jgi:hypothetical protein
MLVANAVTMIFPGALLKTSSKPSIDGRSDPLKPSRSRLVLSEKAPARLPIPVRRTDAGRRLRRRGRLVDLEVAGVHDRAGRRVNRERQTVRHAVGDAQELDANGPASTT